MTEVTPRPLTRSLAPLPEEPLPGYLLHLAYRLNRSPGGISEPCGINSGGQQRIPAVTVHRAASTAPARITCTAGPITRRRRTSYSVLSQRLECYTDLMARAHDEGRDADIPVTCETRVGPCITHRLAAAR